MFVTHDSVLISRQISAQRTNYNFGNVFRKSRRIADAFKRFLSMRASLGIEFFPTVEASGHACGDLWIERIQLDHHIGQEVVAAAVYRMEAQLIGAKTADQCVYLVRVS